MNSSDSLRRGTRGPDVFAWQRFLKAKGIYRGSINGEFDYDTERATGEYQRKNSIEVNGIVSGETLNRACRDGFVRGSEDRKRTEYKPDSGVELSFDARRFLEKIQPDFYDRTGKQLEITSGTRKPRRQAKAMYDNLAANRHVRYANHQAYAEIEDVYERLHNSGEEATVDAMTHVIEEQVSHGVYISNRLKRTAIDVRNRDLSNEEKQAFDYVVTQAGGRINRGEEGTHFHVDFR